MYYFPSNVVVFPRLKGIFDWADIDHFLWIRISRLLRAEKIVRIHSTLYRTIIALRKWFEPRVSVVRIV